MLKNCLKKKIAASIRAKCLDIQTRILTSVYPARHEEIGLIYDMICGHSNFLETVLDDTDSHNEVKAALFRMILALILKDSAICKSKQIPIFLGAYHGSMSKSDQAILEILHLHEINGCSLSEFKPLLWGQSAVSHYSVTQQNNTGLSSLWKMPKVSEVLALIEPKRMIRTAVEFPLGQTTVPKAEEIIRNLNVKDAAEAEGNPSDPTLYDPKFFLPLVCAVCAHGSFVDRHLKLIESGLLSLVFASFSSRDRGMRQVGYLALARIYEQLERAKLTMEKQVCSG